jgi:hypothetical protein
VRKWLQTHPPPFYNAGIKKTPNPLAKMHRERWKLCRKVRIFYFVKLCFYKKLKAEVGLYLIYLRTKTRFIFPCTCRDRYAFQQCSLNTNLWSVKTKVNTRNKYHIHRQLAILLCFQQSAHYGGTKIFKIIHLVSQVMNAMAQFKVALRTYILA